jgi:hypothetical protein
LGTVKVIYIRFRKLKKAGCNKLRIQGIKKIIEILFIRLKAWGMKAQGIALGMVSEAFQAEGLGYSKFQIR